VDDDHNAQLDCNDREVEVYIYIYRYSYRICATALSKAFRNPSKWDERLE
jgi:hypothetical protein